MKCKIRILGIGKTGTTAVYNAIKAPLLDADPGALCLFEPNAQGLAQCLTASPDSSMLVKYMTTKVRPELFADQFTKHILLVRDVRDTLVSHLLYFPLIRRAVLSVTEESLASFIELLEMKERDPTTISFRELFEEAAAIFGPKKWKWDALTDAVASLMQVDHTRSDVFLLKYEDFVQERLESLSDFVGLPLRVVNEDASRGYGHVKRRAGYGDWHAWFLASDVDFFNQLFADYLQRFGYSEEPWDPSRSAIDAQYSSRYVRSRHALLRDKYAKPTGDEPEAAQIETWNHGALNGSGLAAFQLAKSLFEHDRAVALKWAEHGARLGNRRCVQLLVQHESEYRALGGARISIELNQLLSAIDSVAEGDDAGIHTPEPDRDLGPSWDVQVDRQGAARGAPANLLGLALRHRDGAGTERNHARMLRGLERLRALGNPWGIIQLALAYRYGVGVCPDDSAANSLLCLAAEQIGSGRANAYAAEHEQGWRAAAS